MFQLIMLSLRGRRTTLLVHTAAMFVHQPSYPL